MRPRSPLPCRQRRRTRLAVLGVLPILAMLGGCAMPNAATPPHDTATTAGAQAGSTTDPASGPSDMASGAAGAASNPTDTALTPPDDLGTPVASRTATVSSDGGSFRLALDVYPLRRDDHWVRLNARLRVLQAPAGSVAPASLLGANPQDALTDSRPDGFTLTDTAVGLRYRPAVDAAKAPLCSPQLPSSWGTGDTLYVSCVFGAPSSASVTVGTPTFGDFAHVPVA